MVINKSELITGMIRKQNRLSKRDVCLAVNHILQTIQNGLKAGDRIEIRGFGTFSLRVRAGRARMNLQTGEVDRLPASFALYFRPAKELKRRVNLKLAEQNVKSDRHRVDAAEGNRVSF